MKRNEVLLERQLAIAESKVRQLRLCDLIRTTAWHTMYGCAVQAIEDGVAVIRLAGEVDRLRAAGKYEAIKPLMRELRQRGSRLPKKPRQRRRPAA